MLTKCDWSNVDGSISTYSLNSTTSPLNLFDVTVNQRTVTDRERMEQHGIWPTLSFRGAMSIHCEGVLFASDSAGYVSARKTLVKALFGAASTNDLTNRKLGRLTIGLAGESEDWYADCTIQEFTAPVRGNYPALTEYGVTFLSWVPHFIGVTSATKYYWS